jgi:hypothetical protein
MDAMRDLDLIEGARALAQELLSGEGVRGGEGTLKSWIDAHFAGADRYLESG